MFLVWGKEYGDIKRVNMENKEGNLVILAFYWRPFWQKDCNIDGSKTQTKVFDPKNRGTHSLLCHTLRTKKYFLH